MKLFESSWRDGYSYYERYFNKLTNRSETKRIDLPCEWYEPSSNGNFTLLLDSSVTLEQKTGKAKDGREKPGFIAPIYKNIRDNYWKDGNYQDNPRVWYLDIETRCNQSYKFDFGTRKFTVTRISDSTETKMSIEQIRAIENHANSFTFLNDSDEHENLEGSDFYTRNTGFPVPEDANEEISLMQIYDSYEKTMIVLGTREWTHQEHYLSIIKKSHDYPVKYLKCKDEHHLLETYLGIFKKLNPLLLYAWSGMGFDYPYIYNRLNRLGFDTDRLSNYGKTSISENEYKGKIEFKLTTPGHFYIDMIDVYKKFILKPRPNYQLDTIAEIELNERKVQHTEYAAFDDFYAGKYIIPNDPTQEQLDSAIYKAAIASDTEEVKELAHSEFVYYGITDTYLIKQIDEKAQFTQIMCLFAKRMGVQLGDSLGTVRPWSQYIANKSLLNKQIMPARAEHEEPYIVGGYVRDVIRGKHNWILSADVNSMYPLLGMVGSNMSPETFVQRKDLPPTLRDIILKYYDNQLEDERFDIPDDILSACIKELEDHKLSLAVNGAVFSNEYVGMIPEMILDIYKTRKHAKTKQLAYENRQILIQKIINEKANCGKYV